MHKFRREKPARDPNRKVCKHYASYRKTIRSDFNNRCGYCDDSDLLRIRSYSIDHFVPQNPISIDTPIAPNAYENLVWSCSHCNSAKSNKWPTRQANTHNDGRVGFVDPVDIAYSNYFERSIDGSISAQNDDELAKYMIDELNLWLPIHATTWKIERIFELENKVEASLKQMQKSDFKEELEASHYEILKIVKTLTQDLFSENER